MSLGIALTRLKVFSFNKALISSIARVILGPIVGLFLIYLFNLNGISIGFINTMFNAKRYIKLFSWFYVFTKSCY